MADSSGRDHRDSGDDPDGRDDIGDGSGIAPTEHDALVTIARGAVVTSGAVSAQRALTTATEFVLTRGLGP
ncbi:MAG: lipopolysaccharide biosynthesis protein, partial [Halorubrum sp.]